MKVPSIPTPRITLDPPVYFCPRAKGPLQFDGRLDKPFWQDIPFTKPFVDISGPDFPAPRFRTRAKLCWDEDYLYIGALIEGNEIWATLTKRDTVIYYDNDFEVFLDPSSSGHNYMELELNALNTQWDLLLTHPYRNGGRSVSGWDIKGVQSAVHIQGSLNNPNTDNHFWSLEIRIPFASVMETYSKEKNPPDLERCYPCRTAPRQGEFWRMNFSRVQWIVDIKEGRYQKRTDNHGKTLPEDNWVWAATGLIDIHCPEFWGFVFFTENGEPMEIPEDERRKLALWPLFYAEYAHHAAKGCFTADLVDLGCEQPSWPVKIEITKHTFELYSPISDKNEMVCLRSDGYACVEANMKTDIDSCNQGKKPSVIK